MYISKRRAFYSAAVATLITIALYDMMRTVLTLSIGMSTLVSMTLIAVVFETVVMVLKKRSEAKGLM